jgi:hypothetical protein
MAGCLAPGAARPVMRACLPGSPTSPAGRAAGRVRQSVGGFHGIWLHVAAAARVYGPSPQWSAPPGCRAPAGASPAPTRPARSPRLRCRLRAGSTTWRPRSTRPPGGWSWPTASASSRSKSSPATTRACARPSTGPAAGTSTRTGRCAGRGAGTQHRRRPEPARPLDPQAMLAHGQQVSAIVDEMDLGAGLGEPAPEIASDPAGAVDGDPHAHPLSGGR